MNPIKKSVALSLLACSAFAAEKKEYHVFPETPRTKPIVYVAMAAFEPREFSKFEAELKKRTAARGWDYVIDRYYRGHKKGSGKSAKPEFAGQTRSEHRFRVYNNVDMIINMSKAGIGDKANDWFQLYNDIPTIFSSPIRYVNQGGMMLANNTMDRKDHKNKKSWFDNQNPYAQNDHPLWRGVPKDKPFTVTGPGVHVLTERGVVEQIRSGKSSPFIMGPISEHRSDDHGAKGAKRWLLTLGIDKGMTTEMIGGVPFIAEARRTRTFPPHNEANDLAHTLFWNSFEWVAEDVKLRNVVHPQGPGDVNGDGQVSVEDLQKVSNHFGTTEFDAFYNSTADISESNAVTAYDMWQVMKNMGKVY